MSTLYPCAHPPKWPWSAYSGPESYIPFWQGSTQNVLEYTPPIPIFSINTQLHRTNGSASLRQQTQTTNDGGFPADCATITTVKAESLWAASSS